MNSQADQSTYMWIIIAWQHISLQVTDDDSEEDGNIRSEC